MIKADLVNRVSEASDLPRTKSAEAVNVVIQAMKQALADGRRIELRGFGVFEVRDRKRGVGRNPKTGEAVALAGKYVPHFKPGKDLRERVNENRELPIRH